MDIFRWILGKYLLFYKEKAQRIEKIDVVVIGSVSVSAFVMDPVQEVRDKLLCHFVYIYDWFFAAVVVDAKHFDVAVISLERRLFQCFVALFSRDVRHIHLDSFVETSVRAVVVNSWRPA
jgi:hypothetical protein